MTMKRKLKRKSHTVEVRLHPNKLKVTAAFMEKLAQQAGPYLFSVDGEVRSFLWNVKGKKAVAEQVAKVDKFFYDYGYDYE
jgi:hypothetical protein